MNAFEVLLVDLVQIAEAPLYPAYRWLGRQVCRDISLSDFLRLIDELAMRDVLRLWEVDHQSHDRTELFRVPKTLESRYSAVKLDDEYDPLNLSLTIGAAADVDAEPTWEINFDFEDGCFEVVSDPGVGEDAIDQISRYFPELRFVPEQRGMTNGRIRVIGRITERTPGRL